MKKSIFSNHVSRRDLFLYGGHKSQKNDKSSFQQISTQSQEFSQGLDGFNLSSGSSEHLSQGRKMFDSYNTPQSSGNKNLASLMKPISSVSSAPGRPKFQQQYQNNRLKAKENEERELMQTISQTVKECSEEVQNAMKVMPDYLGEHMQMFGDSITKLINDNLQEQFENILLTFQDQKDARHQIGEMKGIIDEKQARIADLQKQLEQYQKTGCQQSMEKVTDVIHKNREHMDKQLLTLIDSNQTITENQQRILEGQENQLNVGNQNHSELQERLDNMPKKMGKNNSCSFAEEIKCIRRELEIQKMEALEFFQGLLTKSSDEQTEDITKQIESEVSRSTKTICNTSSSVANIQKDFLHDTMKEQQEELKAFLKAELQKAHRNQSSQESPDPFTIKHKDYTQSYNDRKCRSAVPIQTEREAVGFVKHQKENDGIRKMDPQQLKFYENPSRGNSNVLTSDIKQKSTQQDFMSPDTNANQSHCKTFFQRPNPSPVATVLPQPQGRGQSRAGKESQEDYEAVNGAQMTQGRAERKNDKFRNIVPKRRSQRIAGFSQNSENSSENGHVSSVPAYASQNFFDSQQLTSNESQHDIVPSYAKIPRYNTQDHESHTSLSKNFVPSADCHVPRQPAYNYGTVRPNVRTPSKKFGKGTDVFQFSEENSNFLKTVHGNPISRINKREKLVENDKEVSEESRDSSPSVSITKIMIKRKSRRDSPASSVFSNFKTYSHPKTKPVVTSTPGYQPSESGWKVNRGDVLTKRHESYKRNLMQVDDDLLELSHRIQNQLKRR